MADGIPASANSELHTRGRPGARRTADSCARLSVSPKVIWAGPSRCKMKARGNSAGQTERILSLQPPLGLRPFMSPRLDSRLTVECHY